MESISRQSDHVADTLDIDEDEGQKEAERDNLI